jgi:hypothetical protein
MSIATLKRKTQAQYNNMSVGSKTGFSLNGTHRSQGYVGQTMLSRSFPRTLMKGNVVRGHGGCCGTYARPEPVYNVNRVIVEGTQNLFVKPTVLTTKGMLEKKYRWINSGQYPNYWVQPNYAGTMQSDTKSQGMYLHTLTASNSNITDINAEAKYVGNIYKCSPTLCQQTTARFKYNDMARNGPYTKELRQAQTASQHTTRIQRRCADPFVYQKPFPYATNGDSCSNSIQYLDKTTPPDWYTNDNLEKKQLAICAKNATANANTQM